MRNSIKFVQSFGEFSKLQYSKADRCLTPPEYDNQKNPIIDAIFAPDPETNLPKGDIAIYLGDKCNPEVREFIRQNLLAEHGQSPALPSGHEDDLFEFIRGKDETPQLYAKRMNELIKSFKVDKESKTE